MPYQVIKSDGSLLATIADGTVDNSTNLVLVGRNFAGYGTAVANNFIRLLENSSTNGTPPSRPLVGQLWYDTSVSLMKVWNGTTWFALTTGVSSVANLNGAITLNQLSTAGVALLASPAFTGNPTVIGTPPAIGTSSTQIATCAFVVNQVGSVVGGVSSVIGLQGAITLDQLYAAGLARLGSPTFTGTVLAPNPPSNSNNQTVATTSWVLSAVGALSTGVSSVLGHSGAVTTANLVAGDGSNPGLAPIASPSFTGTPTAPTPSTGSTNLTQVATVGFVQATTTAAIPASRIYLTGDITFFVSPTGNDTTGTGSQAAPFATMQKAYNLLQSKYDGGGHAATITLMPGTHTVGLSMVGPLYGFTNSGGVLINSTFQHVAGPSNLYANTTTIVNVTNSTCFGVFLDAYLQIEGLTLTAPTGVNNLLQQAGNCLSVADNATCILGRMMIFGAASSAHMLLQGGGSIDCVSDYTITGSAPNHWYMTSMSGAVHNGAPSGFVTVTIVGSVSFSNAYALVGTSSVLSLFGVVFAGTATGKRFIVGTNGLIETNGAGVNYLPGSTAGTGNETVVVSGSAVGVYGGGFYT